MKIKELKKLLDNIDEELDIDIVCTYTEHTCGEGFCYCTNSDHFFYPSNLEKKVKYNKKTKTQDLIGYSIRCEEK
jgi:hypothetical protein